MSNIISIELTILRKVECNAADHVEIWTVWGILTRIIKYNEL